MPRYESARLREERRTIHEQMTRVHQRATREARELTAEERQETDRLGDRFDAVTAELRRAERAEGYSPEQRAGMRPDRDGPTFYAPGLHTRDFAGDLEYRDQFLEYLRTGDARELRAAFATSPSNLGGYAVPESWANSIHDILLDQGVIRSLSTVQETVTGSTLHMPIVATKSTATLRSEAGAISGLESEDTLDTVDLASYEVGQLVKASREFIRDGVGVDQWITRRIGQEIAKKEGALFAVGTGSSEPTGLIPSCDVAKTAATATAIAYSELVDTMFAVPGPYRGNGAAWIMSDTTMAAVMKIEDSEGHLIWQPALIVGQPDLLLGRPAYSDPNVPAIGASKRSVAFGRISEFLIRQVQPAFEVQVLQELYAGNGQIGFIGREYVDSALLTTEAVQVLVHPA